MSQDQTNMRSSDSFFQYFAIVIDAYSDGLPPLTAATRLTTVFGAIFP